MIGDFRIVVISLAASARRERAAKTVDAIGLPWGFFDALREPAEGLPKYDNSRCVRFWGRGLSQTEIGCASSHMKVMAELASSSSEAWRLVLEDDVVLDPGFDYRGLVRMCEAAEIGYLRLYGRHLPSSRHVVWLDQRELTRFVRAPMGTQAYLISRTAARGFMDSVCSIDRPIDWEMDRFWVNGLDNYAIFPFPCLELTVQSSISKAPEIATACSLLDSAVLFAWKSKEYIHRGWRNLLLYQKDRHIRSNLSAGAGRWKQPIAQAKGEEARKV